MSDLFLFINNCFEKKARVRSDRLQFNNYYMVNRFLSMNAATFWQAVDINEMSLKIPRWAVGCLMHQIVPRRDKAPFIKYIKRSQDKTAKSLSTKAYKEIIERLGDMFCLSELHAKQVFELLERQGIDLHRTFGKRKGK